MFQSLHNRASFPSSGLFCWHGVNAAFVFGPFWLPAPGLVFIVGRMFTDLPTQVTAYACLLKFTGVCWLCGDNFKEDTPPVNTISRLLWHLYSQNKQSSSQRCWHSMTNRWSVSKSENLCAIIPQASFNATMTVACALSGFQRHALDHFETKRCTKVTSHHKCKGKSQNLKLQS